ncbi:hypothetical protein GCM10009641_34040 [Mycobacterium cookii]|uniref:Lipoprotein n=1 Tax=Nocardioides furvisabuli TaxID=375542 RepID=A0ABP5ILH0_9ACTN|nr:hypothetical protein [Nocardioides furvisabuli]
MRRIRLHQVVVALSVACVATGCSVYDDLTTSDFAKQDGDAIVAAASEAMLDVQSMRITGQARSRGNQFFIDLRLDREDNCTGTVRLGGSNIDIRRVGDRVWLKGESGAYNRLSSTPLPRHLLEKLSTTWVLFEDDKEMRRLCDLEDLLRSFEVVDLVESDGSRGQGQGEGKGAGKGKGRGRADDLSGDVPTTAGDETSEDGQKVVRLSGSPGGQHEELAWVRSEAPHHVVRLESTSTQDGGAIAFSEFDEEFEVAVPEDEDVMRP